MSDDAKVPLPVPVARVWELTLHERDRVLAKHGPVLVAPLYLHDQLRTYGDARERAARAAAFAEAAEVCADMAEDGRSAQLEGYTVSSDAIRAHEMCADALRARAESEAGHG